MKALILALAIMGTAMTVPGLAAQPTVCATHTGSVDLADIQTRLQGPNITNVEQWGGCLRVTIRNADGRLSEVLVDPQTLQVVPGGVIVR